jgi:DNA-binding GntR family transcriptional regulator
MNSFNSQKNLDLFNQGDGQIKYYTSNRVLDILREAIITGKLQPNQRITEIWLADKLGVSRTPVREAMHRLEEQGYLTRINGKLVISSQTKNIVQNIFEIREALEGMAIRLSCERITDEQLNKAAEYHKLASQLIESNNSTIEEYAELNLSFETELYLGACNDRLLDLIKIYGMDQYFYIHITRLFSRKEWKTILRQHAKILEAVQQRNGNAADKAVRSHLRWMMNLSLERV